MKVTLTFELPKDFTKEEKESFKEDIRSAAMESIKNIFENRGCQAAEQVAESIEVEETGS
jgi:hypothetical protein